MQLSLRKAATRNKAGKRSQLRFVSSSPDGFFSEGIITPDLRMRKCQVISMRIRPPSDSNRTMLAIHGRGGALIPMPSLVEAQRIATQITVEAQRPFTR